MNGSSRPKRVAFAQKVTIAVMALMISTLVIDFLLGSRTAFAQDYNRDIRPILSDRCFKCHGPDSQANESGLRLDIESEAHQSGAFEPGDVEGSSSIERILEEDPDLKMPPPESHLTITDAELELIKSWVKAGANYDQHWAFKPLPKVVITPHFSQDREWIQNNIDVFVMRSLEAKKLTPSKPAERWQWLRRVTYDLTGLPPTAEELTQFELDDSFNAYEKVVDRLLASPRFGEHMSVSWLDAARYADSFGYQSDNLSPTWPYRDWVIRSLNNNLPYNEFLTWQLAGDLLASTGDSQADRDRKLATAFNRLHRQTNEGGSVELEWRTEYVADRVNTFGTAMLGMTLECARCHDHKYDPVSHQDYYNVFSFFNNIDEWGMYHDSARVPTPTLLLPTDQQQKQLEQISAATAEAGKAKLFVDDGRAQKWLDSNKLIDVDLPKPVAHWTLDEIDEKIQLANSAEGGKRGRTSANNKLVKGVSGMALKMTGDDAAEFPVDGNWLEPWQPYSISFWLNIPKELNEGVILHRQGGTDVGNFGTKVSIEDGRVRFAIVRFWPGNALAVETSEPIAKDRWVHLTVTNDGSCDAEGMSVYVEGKLASKVLRNNLTKDPQYRPGNNPGFIVGQQFRRTGLKGGIIDEITVHDLALSPVEVRSLSDGQLAAQEFTAEALQQHIHCSTMTLGERRQVSELRKKLLQARVGVAETMVMQEMAGTARPAYVLNRGEYDAVRTEDNRAFRKTPSALPPMPEEFPKDRLGLAKWLTADDHPLTARVAVNRIWQGFFGEGLADTPNDFGFQSSLPEHPELLDWLAREFVDSGWDTKRLCKRIVLSNTYRQASRCDKELRQNDPQNRWLARGPALRLTAEMIRDTALFTSGLLNEEMHGPPVSPYQPINIWRENNTMTPAYRQSVGKALYRRSLYTIWKRTTPMPNMMTFDATSREVCTVQRSRTNTPQQAMVLLNDVQFVEAARVLAEKALAEREDGDRVQWLFTRLTGRKADEREAKILLRLLDEQRAEFSKDRKAAEKLISLGEAKRNAELDAVELAANTVLVQAVLSSDATIWKR